MDPLALLAWLAALTLSALLIAAGVVVVVGVVALAVSFIVEALGLFE